jgi:hypothetical protein
MRYSPPSLPSVLAAIRRRAWFRFIPHLSFADLARPLEEPVFRPFPTSADFGSKPLCFHFIESITH